MEPPSRTRSPFRLDCDRVIHSTAFRRLKHKTQVFVFHEGDHYRTRLTHSLEVAQIARALARQLGLDEDLTETLALAHDLGHPPFGHAGERALDKCLAAHGGFDHNAQALRVVTSLEHRYPEFDGLNLTWESLEGIVKHNGPLTGRDGAPIGPCRESGIPVGIADFDRKFDLQLWSYASLEAQVAAFADDIAYDAHDIDDGLRAGLMTFDDLAEVGLTGGILADIRADYPGLPSARAAHELTRRLITAMIEDVIVEALRRLDRLAPGSADDIRRAGEAVVGFSAAFAEADAGIKALLKRRVYRHERVMAVMREAEDLVGQLFARYIEDPAALPEEWRSPADFDETRRARHAADFLAGMTDRYAAAEYLRLVGNARPASFLLEKR